jgi:cytochrome c oxidase cbb3-type subunit 3
MRLILIILFSLTGAVAWAAPDGAQLYAAHCATCHGDNGNGGVGVPLDLPSFLESVDDNFLRQTIRHGRPGRVMPAFPKLSAAQLDALVGYIRNWSGKPAPEFAATPVKGDPLHGKALFAGNCAACHGDNGEGGKGTGVTFSRSRDLPVVAPALNNPGFLQAATDEMIRHTLRYGREGTSMRSYREQGLSEEDISDLVAYVRSFETQGDASRLAKAVSDEKIIIAESPYSLDETVENLKNAIVSQNFQLIRTDLLEHGLVEEGKESKQEVILHFCNFKFLYDALAIDPRVGLFLPCRVTVVEHEGKVKVMTINPLYLSHLFNNKELDEACKQMHAIYTAIIEDATL